MKTKLKITEGSLVIFSNFEHEDSQLVYNYSNGIKTSIYSNGKKCRVALLKTERFEVAAIFFENEFLKSSKKSKSFLELIALSAPYIQDIVEQAKKDAISQNRRILHNIKSLNAHSIQEYGYLIPQDNLVKNTQKEQVSYLSSIISNDIKTTAVSLLKIAKYNSAIKSEFTVFEYLHNNQKPVLNKRKHNVYKALRTIIDMFYQDFSEKNVFVEIDCDQKSTAEFDFECIRFALYHLLENSAKYTKNNTSLSIKSEVSEDGLKITLDMFSLQIEDDEIEKIFDEGFSGKNARSSFKQGSGIGLFMTKSILQICNASISVKKIGNVEKWNQLSFQRNIFEIVVHR